MSEVAQDQRLLRFTNEPIAWNESRPGWDSVETECRVCGTPAEEEHLWPVRYVLVCRRCQVYETWAQCVGRKDLMTPPDAEEIAAAERLRGYGKVG